MNQHQKECIAALRAEGISYGKIADRLGVSINTVKSYCKRSLSGVTADNNQQKNHIKETCLRCGQTLMQTPGHRQKKFCSASCRHNWWLTHPGSTHRSAEHDCTCLCCGRIFRYYGNRPRKYCSRSCYQKQRKVQGGDGRG